MKISITSWSFPACSLQESWDITKALGISRMDVGLLHGATLNRSEILQDPLAAAKIISDMGINISNLYWLFGTSPQDRPLSDLDAAEKNLADYVQVLSFANALNIPSLFLLPGVATTGKSQKELLSNSARVLNAMLPLAAAQNIALSVEPHIGGLLNSPVTTLDFLEQVQGLKLTLDYAHFACMGFAQSDIDVLAPHAAHVHMRQARPGALQAKMAEGTLDFVAMVETLRDANYGGYLSIEYVHQDYLNTLFDDVLTETIKMRDLLRGCGVN